MTATPRQLHDAEIVVLPANVVQALSRVLDDLPGISKGDRASQAQGGYAYRGIEAITKEAAPLFAKHGVVFVPHVLSWERDEITVNGKPWTDDRMTISYTVYGPGGAADCIEVGPIPAIGRDNSDKGANKCMTQAFKYALLQVLCIADGKDDGDRESHEAEFADVESETTRRRPEPMPGFETLAKQRAAHEEYEQLAAAQSEDVKEALKRWRAEQRYPYPMSAEQLSAARVYLGSITASGAGEPVQSGDDADKAASDAHGQRDDAAEPVASSPVPVSEVPGDTDTREGSEGSRRDGPDESPGAQKEGSGYDEWKKLDLIAECAAREIDVPVNSKNADLVEKLRAWDRQYAPDAIEYAERPF